MPALRPSRGERMFRSWPWTVTVPSLARSAPKMARTSSVRREPTSPAIPSSSPLRSSKLASMTPVGEERFSTVRSCSPLPSTLRASRRSGAASSDPVISSISLVIDTSFVRAL